MVMQLKGATRQSVTVNTVLVPCCLKGLRVSLSLFDIVLVPPCLKGLCASLSRV